MRIQNCLGVAVLAAAVACAPAKVVTRTEDKELEVRTGSAPSGQEPTFVLGAKKTVNGAEFLLRTRETCTEKTERVLSRTQVTEKHAPVAATAAFYGLGLAGIGAGVAIIVDSLLNVPAATDRTTRNPVGKDLSLVIGVSSAGVGAVLTALGIGTSARALDSRRSLGQVVEAVPGSEREVACKVGPVPNRPLLLVPGGGPEAKRQPFLTTGNDGRARARWADLPVLAELAKAPDAASSTVEAEGTKATVSLQLKGGRWDVVESLDAFAEEAAAKPAQAAQAADGKGQAAKPGDKVAPAKPKKTGSTWTMVPCASKEEEIRKAVANAPFKKLMAPASFNRWTWNGDAGKGGHLLRKKSAAEAFAMCAFVSQPDFGLLSPEVQARLLEAFLATNCFDEKEAGSFAPNGICNQRLGRQQEADLRQLLASPAFQAKADSEQAVAIQSLKALHKSMHWAGYDEETRKKRNDVFAHLSETGNRSRSVPVKKLGADAEAGNVDAMADLADALWLGLGDAVKDTEGALHWYKKAADGGSARAMTALANVVRQQGDREIAAALEKKNDKEAAELRKKWLDEEAGWLMKAAAAGDPDAFFRLGAFDRPTTNAAELLEKAAEAGSPDAARRLAATAKKGAGDEAAKIWKGVWLENLTKRAEAGNAEAGDLLAAVGGEGPRSRSLDYADAGNVKDAVDSVDAEVRYAFQAAGDDCLEAVADVRRTATEPLPLAKAELVWSATPWAKEKEGDAPRTDYLPVKDSVTDAQGKIKVCAQELAQVIAERAGSARPEVDKWARAAVLRVLSFKQWESGTWRPSWPTVEIVWPEWFQIRLRSWLEWSLVVDKTKPSNVRQFAEKTFGLPVSRLALARFEDLKKEAWVRCKSGDVPTRTACVFQYVTNYPDLGALASEIRTAVGDILKASIRDADPACFRAGFLSLESVGRTSEPVQTTASLAATWFPELLRATQSACGRGWQSSAECNELAGALAEWLPHVSATRPTAEADVRKWQAEGLKLAKEAERQREAAAAKGEAELKKKLGPEWTAKRVCNGAADEAKVRATSRSQAIARRCEALCRAATDTRDFCLRKCEWGAPGDACEWSLTAPK